LLKLNQVILAESPSAALQNESGVFELASPQGEVILVTCEPGLMLGAPQQVSFDPQRARSDHCWEIKKIAELPGGGHGIGPAP
jgi:hypothetical protein